MARSDYSIPPIAELAELGDFLNRINTDADKLTGWLIEKSFVKPRLKLIEVTDITATSSVEYLFDMDLLGSALALNNGRVFDDVEILEGLTQVTDLMVQEFESSGLSLVKQVIKGQKGRNFYMRIVIEDIFPPQERPLETIDAQLPCANCGLVQPNFSW